MASHTFCPPPAACRRRVWDVSARDLVDGSSFWAGRYATVLPEEAVCLSACDPSVLGPHTDTMVYDVEEVL